MTKLPLLLTVSYTWLCGCYAAVAHMMYGFGDDRTPYKESVELVEVTTSAPAVDQIMTVPQRLLTVNIEGLLMQHS